MKSKRIKVITIYFTWMSLVGGILAYLLIFHVPQGTPKETWSFGLSSYHRILLGSQQTQQPILLYLRRKACYLCIDFEKKFFNNPQLNQTLAAYRKVQIIIDENKDTEVFARQFKSEASPSLFVIHDQNHPISTYLILETSQIWVIRQQTEAGNFMPLSSASFELALDGARWHAKHHELRAKKNNDKSE